LLKQTILRLVIRFRDQRFGCENQNKFSNSSMPSKQTKILMFLAMPLLLPRRRQGHADGGGNENRRVKRIFIKMPGKIPMW